MAEAQQKAKTISDGCFFIVYENKNGTVVTRKKRRPKWAKDPRVCTWNYGFCPDHPDTERLPLNGRWS
jgi:hypothetical protein